MDIRIAIDEVKERRRQIRTKVEKARFKRNRCALVFIELKTIFTQIFDDWLKWEWIFHPKKFGGWGDFLNALQIFDDVCIRINVESFLESEVRKNTSTERIKGRRRSISFRWTSERSGLSKRSRCRCTGGVQCAST